MHPNVDLQHALLLEDFATEVAFERGLLVAQAASQSLVVRVLLPRAGFLVK